MTSSCVIFNPVAKGDKARRFHRHLGELASDCVLKPTTGPGVARQLAREAVEAGFQTIAAAGGDGTLNEVLNGIADAPQGLTRVALGIIPLGTANVFARELGIPLRMAACWDILRQGKTDTVDLVRASYQAQGKTVERFFAQVAGAGLDARAVELVDWKLKKRTGFLAYVVAGLKALTETQPRITASTDQGESQGQLVLLGNGRLYGGPFPLFPNAHLRDGRLDVRVFPQANWITASKVGFALLTRRFDAIARSQQLTVATLDLRADRRTPLQIDGELAGELPARFEVVPQALRVIVP